MKELHSATLEVIKETKQTLQKIKSNASFSHHSEVTQDNAETL